jgi:hypothetical protein
MQQHFLSFESSELQKNKPNSSSHCSSVQERLVTYGSEALDTAEHLGLIVGSQKQADALLDHFGSLTVLARASVEELLPFVSRSKALRLVSSLRMGAVALREGRESLTIDSPLAIADLCSEMRFLDREYLRVVLLNAKQYVIKVCTVSKAASMSRWRILGRYLSPPFSIPPTPLLWCTIIPPGLYRVRHNRRPFAFRSRYEAHPENS